MWFGGLIFILRVEAELLLRSVRLRRIRYSVTGVCLTLVAGIEAEGLC